MKLDVGGKRKNRESGEGEKREVRQFIHVAGGRKMQRIRRQSGPHRVKRQGGLGIDKEGGESKEEREKRVKKRKVLKFTLIPVIIRMHAATLTHITVIQCISVRPYIKVRKHISAFTMYWWVRLSRSFQENAYKTMNVFQNMYSILADTHSCELHTVPDSEWGWGHRML